MALSSNSIIHFTKTKRSLKGILENNFKIRFCKETFDIANKTYGIVVPMVSFCDIPLSEVKNHIHKYGSYGIGFTKEWAERNQLNPVLYLSAESNLAASIDVIWDDYIVKSSADSPESLNDSEKSVLDMFRYIKNYQGDLSRGGEVKKNYRYSDEREWRYVPSFDNDCSMVLSRKECEDDAYAEELQKRKTQLDSLELSFEPNDIKYIIIENDDEIGEFLEFLKRAKGNSYTFNDIERLMTRILTTEQIVSDI